MAREECVCVCVLRWNKEVQRGEVCPNWFLWDSKKQKELTNPKLAPDSEGHLLSAAIIALLTSHPSRSSLRLLLRHCYTPRRTSRGGWAGEWRYVTPAISPSQTTDSKGASDLWANQSGESQPRRGKTEGWGACEPFQDPRRKKQKNMTS